MKKIYEKMNLLEEKQICANEKDNHHNDVGLCSFIKRI